ncbi:MAG: hypothetical protein HN356_07215 [Calditrichaeota bacterium]|nr:hypothetical protein [Calditrichota bacterium]
MKRILLMSLFLIGLFFLNGCPGSDGEDGRAYMSISFSDTQPLSYWDNNPSMPYGLRYGRSYLSEPGIFDFEYFVTEDQSWAGTYEIYIEEGEKGHDFFVDGDDGWDIYLTLLRDPDGPTFQRYSNPRDTYDGVDINSVDMEQNAGGYSIRIKAEKQFGQTPGMSPKVISSSR